MHPHRPDHALFRAEEAIRLMKYSIYPLALDLACGDGTFGSILLLPGAVGVDLNSVELAKADINGDYSLLIAANAGALPFGNGVFQTVLSNCALEHMDNAAQAVSEIARSLALGGTFIFTIPPDSFKDILFPYRALKIARFDAAAEIYFKRMRKRMTIANLMGKEEWIQLLNENGFEVVESVPYLPGSSGIVWSFLFHLMSARVPLPGRWKQDGVSFLLKGFLKHLPRSLYENLIYAFLSRFILREAKKDEPSAGIVFYAIKKV